MSEKEFYNKRKDWNFNEFNIKEETITNWDLIETLKSICKKDTKILDLGTGGGEVVLNKFPVVKEILGTDYSDSMIKTALNNLKDSNRTDVQFRVMDNYIMDTEKNYYDIVVARNTVTDPKQIYDTLKSGGYLLIRGVDKYDCYELKRVFGKGQGMDDIKPISIDDYEKVLDAGFKEVELIPIHTREYFKTIEDLERFLIKVPIINTFLENEKDISKAKDSKLLNEYVKNNTFEKGIRLLRRYYGIVAKK